MKLQGLQVFLATAMLATSTVFAQKKAKKAKKMKKGSRDCSFIKNMLSEPSNTDAYVAPGGNITEADDYDYGTGVPGGMWMWEDNPICTGAIPDADACSGANLVGHATGTCATFPSGNCDSVDYFKFIDGSLLYFRGFDYGVPGPSVVIGGTGCFDSATGTVETEFYEGTDAGVDAEAW
eukprot:CAMPEP_0194358282 /NCGR_PEP_ID=MMETSP0174-20130528/5541_1 /TAXON_ID=216777 /ORGANISM="Proboscia alata, Strain PI-D3" /LENGTH=178 /DNA_ID=CAMNT_0039128547 /DNA_START=92 /DNA_END=625 /DNA_ORIENTATION=-